MSDLNLATLESRLINIASGKGGVGKTWLSVTLADTLARAGKRVLLFDGDLGLANVDIQLGLMPKRDIGDVINGSVAMADAITRFQPDGSKYYFDILAGKSGSGALGSLTREKLASIRLGLTMMAEKYDYVLLDLAAGIDPSVTTLADNNGVQLIVMTADPTSLTDAYAFIKLKHMRQNDANFQIVVNNVATKREGEKAYQAIKKACEGFLKISPPLAAIIKNDKKVVDAIRGQTPLLARYPQSEAASRVNDLVEVLAAG